MLLPGSNDPKDGNTGVNGGGPESGVCREIRVVRAKSVQSVPVIVGYVPVQ